MKAIKYNNKDFGQFRNILIEHAKNYFPNTYKDFNEASPGMMFIEMAAVVGDILSHYNDKQLQESLLNLSSERKNVFNLAQNYGYKPNTVVPAQVDIEVMQLIPAQYVDNQYSPAWDYALHIKEGMELSTDDGVKFRTIESVNFAVNEKSRPTKISIFETLPNGTITYFLLIKKVRAVAGSIFTQNYTFTTPKKYDKIVIDDDNVAEIISVKEIDNSVYYDTWYEVPFLAQDLIPVPVLNIEYNNPDLAIFKSTVPYILTYRRVDKRFVTRLRSDDKFEIQFGAGLNDEADEEVVPNPYNVGIGIDYFRRVEDVSIDPMNFLNTHTYGTAPSDVTLEVKYTKCNGILDNVKADTITIIENIEFYDMPDSLNQETVELLKYDNDKGIKVNNPAPAYGGLNNKPLDLIKSEAMANFASQNRAVTKEDYIIRALTMPARYGSIAKVYIERDEQISNWGGYVSNINALNLYVLGYNESNEFVEANEALKENLRRYLSQYRLLTDAINIKDAFIVNIGINFDIIAKESYNANEVIIRCIKRLKEYFHQDNMEINKPIILSKIYSALDEIEGVQTVSDVVIYNKISSGYSNNEYDIKSATRDGIIYPSVDPCVFEIKYPDRDIKGRIVEI